MSEAEDSKNHSLATDILREMPEDARFESELAELAARFAAKSGGGLTPELSAELALEIVLNEIVETACRTTGATGAAIVLEREGEMACRASSGATAPELGSRLEILSGLSGECLRTHRTQWSDDALADPRVDSEASQRLGVRSVIVMPLLQEERLVGVFELFSVQPYAFGTRDERVLESLAQRTLSSLQCATRRVEAELPQPVLASAPESAADGAMTEAPSIFPEEVPEPQKPARQAEAGGLRKIDAMTWALGAAVVVAAVLLGAALGRHWSVAQKATPQPGRAAAPVATGPQAPQPPVTAPAKNSFSAKNNPSPKASAPAKSNPRGAVPPGGLMVFERGKEVFRLAPTHNRAATAVDSGDVHLASELEPDQVIELSPAVAEREVIRRVEPQYPDAALQQKIEGEVVLEVHIGTDGSVQDVQVVSGPPLLTEASSQAVRQWKFRTKVVNGRPVEMQTTVRLNFKLPA